jgi:hypothetical protein
VPLGRADTICWACRHLVKRPGVYIKYVWIWTSLELAAAIAVVVVLVKYKTQVEGALQTAIRSVLQSH